MDSRVASRTREVEWWSPLARRCADAMIRPRLHHRRPPVLEAAMASQDARTDSPSSVTPPSSSARTCATRRRCGARSTRSLPAPWPLPVKSCTDAPALAPRVVETAFVNVWQQRATLTSLQQFKKVLADEVTHGAARALSRRVSAQRFGGLERARRTDDDRDSPRVGSGGRRRGVGANHSHDSRRGEHGRGTQGGRVGGAARCRDAHEGHVEGALVDGPDHHRRSGALPSPSGACAS